MAFKIDFDIKNYLDVLPSIEEYSRNDEILNFSHWRSGDLDNCIWQKKKVTKSERESSYFKEIEARRLLKTGVWIHIKDEVVWIPPQYYNALQYGRVGDDDLQFRLKRLKHVYEKIRARKNEYYKGTLTMKNRADGETTMAINDAFWEMMVGHMNAGVIGIQSKTREDAINPCWSTAQTFWQAYPAWYKEMLFPDFASGDKIAEKMKFMRPEDEDADIRSRNITFQYFACAHNAMDGKHNVRRCILDEICKWVQAEFGTTFTNYSKFISPGLERRGLFDMFSSPADVQTNSNEQVAELWAMSDPNDLDPVTNCTKSRIYRIYSNPLDGIQGTYDKWGDADPQFILDHIMRERKNAGRKRQQEEIRGFPLNEAEMFDAPDSVGQWSNQQGLKDRKQELWDARVIGNPEVSFGNLEWIDGNVDSDVRFRPADMYEFDEDIARFCISNIQKENEKEPLRYGLVNGFFGEIGIRPLPPESPADCLGVDPYAKRFRTSDSNSKAGMVNWNFLDFYQTGIVKYPTLIYCVRPSHADIFHEDAIKASVFNRAMMQPENISDKLIDYCQDRGYNDWMLTKRGSNDNNIKGDAPSGGRSNVFLDEVISLIDAVTNTPVVEGEQYLLLLNHFYELIEDILNFSRKNTKKSDLTMAFGQALIGAKKMMSKAPKAPNPMLIRALEIAARRF